MKVIGVKEVLPPKMITIEGTTFCKMRIVLNMQAAANAVPNAENIGRANHWLRIARGAATAVDTRAYEAEVFGLPLHKIPQK
jgi:hypothetical protein